MSEEIFIKDKTQKKNIKAKKKLSQAQLDGLAKGRARMAEKRAAKKAQQDKGKMEKDLKAQQENAAVQKEERRLKNKHIKLEKEQEIQRKFTEAQDKKRNDAISSFSQLKYNIMEQAQNYDDYFEFKEIMDTVSDDMILDSNKLYSHLETHLTKYKVEPPSNSHKQNLEMIMEEQKP